MQRTYNQLKASVIGRIGILAGVVVYASISGRVTLIVIEGYISGIWHWDTIIVWHWAMLYSMPATFMFTFFLIGFFGPLRLILCGFIKLGRWIIYG